MCGEAGRIVCVPDAFIFFVFVVYLWAHSPQRVQLNLSEIAFEQSRTAEACSCLLWWFWGCALNQEIDMQPYPDTELHCEMYLQFFFLFTTVRQRFSCSSARLLPLSPLVGHGWGGSLSQLPLGKREALEESQAHHRANFSESINESMSI